MSRDLLAGSRLVKRTVWRLLRRFARGLGADGARLFGHTVGELTWLLDARGRRTVEANLAPLVPGREARRRTARACYRACAEGVALTLRLDRLRPRDLPGLTIVDPHRILPLRGPAVLATVHADWDAMLGCLSRHRLVEGLASIALPAGDEAVDRLLAEVRGAAGASAIPWQGAARGALRHLRAGGVVGVLGDRDYSGTAMEVHVGGRILLAPTGPADLARRAGCALVPMACLRGRGRTMLVAGKPLDPRSMGTEEATRAFIRFQLRLLSAAPGRWVAFHPIWR